MIAIKPGVKVGGIKPEILLAINIAREAWPDATLTITSVVEGVHMNGSLHPKGYAVDLRLPAEADHREKVVGDLRALLQTDYDVILEKDHIHIEYDPK